MSELRSIDPDIGRAMGAVNTSPLPELPEFAPGDLPPLLQEVIDHGEVISETLPSIIEPEKLSIQGMRVAIASRRLEKAERKAASPEILKETATAISEHRLPEFGPRDGTFSERTQALGVARPTTWLERNQAFRADRRQRKINLKRSRYQHNLRMIYGGEIGTAAHVARIDGERLTRSERNAERNAGKQYNKNREWLIDKEWKGNKSRRGEDIPGSISRTIAKRASKRIPKLERRLGRLEGSEAEQDNGHEAARNRAAIFYDGARARAHEVIGSVAERRVDYLDEARRDVQVNNPRDVWQPKVEKIDRRKAKAQRRADFSRLSARNHREQQALLRPRRAPLIEV